MDELLGGNAVEYDENTFNERQIVKLYIQDMPDDLNTAVLGSSRSLQLTKEYSADETSFFNFGVSGGDLFDILGMYYLLFEADKLPENLILVLDGGMLHDSPDLAKSRADKELYNEFLSVELGIQKEYEKPDYSTLIESLISPSVFQENIEYYFRDTSLETKPVAVPFTENSYENERSLRLPDGSQVYPIDFRKTPQDDVDFMALEMITYSFYLVEGMQEIDPDMSNIFELFLDHAEKNGVEITFVLPSYHPVVYNGALDGYDRFPAFFDVEPYLKTLADRKSVV